MTQSRQLTAKVLPEPMKPKLIVGLMIIIPVFLAGLLAFTYCYKKMHGELRMALGAYAIYEYNTSTSLTFQSLDGDTLFPPQFRVAVSLMFPDEEGLDYYITYWTLTSATRTAVDETIKDLQRAVLLKRTELETRSTEHTDLNNQLRARVDIAITDDEIAKVRSELEPLITAKAAEIETCATELSALSANVFARVPEFRP